MNHQRSFDPECIQRLGDRPKQLRIGDAEQLNLRPRRIQAWTEQVHDGPDLQRSADRSGMGDARMILRREEEAKAGLVENPARLRSRKIHLRPQCFEDIGRTALRGEGSVAVLHDRQSAAGRDDRGRRRHVD